MTSCWTRVSDISHCLLGECYTIILLSMYGLCLVGLWGAVTCCDIASRPQLRPKASTRHLWTHLCANLFVRKHITVVLPKSWFPWGLIFQVLSGELIQKWYQQKWQQTDYCDNIVCNNVLTFDIFNFSTCSYFQPFIFSTMCICNMTTFFARMSWALYNLQYESKASVESGLI